MVRVLPIVAFSYEVISLTGRGVWAATTPHILKIVLTRNHCTDSLPEGLIDTTALSSSLAVLLPPPRLLNHNRGLV